MQFVAELSVFDIVHSKKIEKSEPECNKATVLKSLNNEISYKIHKA